MKNNRQIKNEFVMMGLKYVVPTLLSATPLFVIAYYEHLYLIRTTTSITIGATLPITLGTLLSVALSFSALSRVNWFLGAALTTTLLFLGADLLFKCQEATFPYYVGEVLRGSGIFSVFISIFAAMGDLLAYQSIGEFDVREMQNE